MARRNEADLLAYARDALAILRRCASLYDGGERAFYRVMAVELRLLLCDTTRRHDQLYDLSLAPRLWPDLALPPLGEDGQFQPLSAPLPLVEWLEQQVRLAPERAISLRDLIRQVCDQDGGAHVDRRLHTGLPAGADASGWLRKIAGVVIQVMGEET